jgi:hypothetical protein
MQGTMKTLLADVTKAVLQGNELCCLQRDTRRSAATAAPLG